jgi:hypothetical protein
MNSSKKFGHKWGQDGKELCGILIRIWPQIFHHNAMRLIHPENHLIVSRNQWLILLSKI